MDTTKHNVVAKPITQGPKHHFFGYYGVCPWDATGRYVLCLESDFHERPPNMAPLIYLQDPDKYTIALALRQFQNIYGQTQYHLMMAVAVLTVVPIIVLFFFTQRTFVQGIALTGIKG